MSFALFLLYHVVLSLWWWVWVWVVPSDYFVSTQLQLWFFAVGVVFCWAVTISSYLQINVEILDIYIFGTDRPIDRPTDKARYRSSLLELNKIHYHLNPRSWLKLYSEFIA